MGGEAEERRGGEGGEDEAWLGSVRARRAGRLRGLQGGVGRLESALFAPPPPVELPMVSATPLSPHSLLTFPWSPLPPLRPSTRPRSLSSGETMYVLAPEAP